jgi:hypothetical protein
MLFFGGFLGVGADGPDTYLIFWPPSSGCARFALENTVFLKSAIHHLAPFWGEVPISRKKRHFLATEAPRRAGASSEHGEAKVPSAASRERSCMMAIARIVRQPRRGAPHGGCFSNCQRTALRQAQDEGARVAGAWTLTSYLQSGALLPGGTGQLPPPWLRLSHGKAVGFGAYVKAALGLIAYYTLVTYTSQYHIMAFF